MGPAFIKSKQNRTDETRRLAAEGLVKLSQRKLRPPEIIAPDSTTISSLETTPKIYFPSNDRQNVPHAVINGYNVGYIKVSCHLSSTTVTLDCYDHGQFPWERDNSQ